MYITKTEALKTAISALISLPKNKKNQAAIQILREMLSEKSHDEKGKEELLADFAEQFMKIQPKSCKDYNMHREKGSPTWLTVARSVGVTTWLELVKLAKVDAGCLRRKPEIPKKYTVESSSALYEKLERLIKNG